MTNTKKDNKKNPQSTVERKAASEVLKLMPKARIYEMNRLCLLKDDGTLERVDIQVLREFLIEDRI